MPAPSFIQESETSYAIDTATSKVTPSFNALAGDIIVAAAGSEDNARPLGAISGGTLTWTERQKVAVASYCEALQSTATVDVDKSMTVTVPCSGGADRAYGANALTFRGSDGVGASAKTNAAGAPSLAITTTQANSAIVVCVFDWNAADGATRTWRSVNGAAATELLYFRDSTRYTAYVAYHPDAGAAGAQTVGLSAPGGQAFAIVAVEIKGTAAVAQIPALVMAPMRPTR